MVWEGRLAPEGVQGGHAATEQGGRLPPQTPELQLPLAFLLDRCAHLETILALYGFQPAKCLYYLDCTVDVSSGSALEKSSGNISHTFEDRWVKRILGTPCSSAHSGTKTAARLVDAAAGSDFTAVAASLRCITWINSAGKALDDIMEPSDCKPTVPDRFSAVIPSPICTV